MRQHAGFTLVELSVTLAVAALLIALALPSFQSLMQSNSLDGQSRELATALRLGRQSAIEYNTNSKVCALGTRSSVLDKLTISSCSGSDWTKGWAVFRQEGASTWKLVAEFAAPDGQISLITRDGSNNTVTDSEVTFSSIGTVTSRNPIRFYVSNGDCGKTVAIETLTGLVESGNVVCS